MTRAALSITLLLLAPLAGARADYAIGVTGDHITVQGNDIQGVSTGGDWWDGLALSNAWTLGATSGTTATDSIGTANGAGVNLTWAEVDGIQCAVFNGTSTQIDFGDVCDIGSGDVTLGGWFWINDASSVSGLIFGKGQMAAALPGYYGLGLASGLTPRAFAYSDGLSTFGNAATTSNTWHFLSCSVTYESGAWSARFGLNGVYYLTRTSGAATNNLGTAASLYLGKGVGIDARWFKGYASKCFFGPGGTSTATRVYNATKTEYGK